MPNMFKTLFLFQTLYFRSLATGTTNIPSNFYNITVNIIDFIPKIDLQVGFEIVVKGNSIELR